MYCTVPRTVCIATHKLKCCLCLTPATDNLDKSMKLCSSTTKNSLAQVTEAWKANPDASWIQIGMKLG